MGSTSNTHGTLGNAGSPGTPEFSLLEYLDAYQMSWNHFDMLDAIVLEREPPENVGLGLWHVQS